MSNFNNTPIVIASIPPHIWEQDKGIWKQWVTSIDVSFKTKETYKRIITHFYGLLNLSISQVTEQHINDYRDYLVEDGRSERTVRTYITVINKYWRFAQTLPEEVTV
jgi:site-specific recombinase XerD